MARNVYTVEAWVVDANGNFNYLEDYPKKFDSKSYNDNVDVAKKRAEGEFSTVWGAFCKRDDRMIQVVTMEDAFGNQLDKKSMGDFQENVPPETT